MKFVLRWRTLNYGLNSLKMAKLASEAGGPSLGGLGWSEARPAGLLAHPGDTWGAGVEPHDMD
jgi:hypothetical protein